LDPRGELQVIRERTLLCGGQVFDAETGHRIHEQTLGSADAMLLRLLDGDESMGGTKQPYDPRIHFVLIRDAYMDANPDNKALHKWLDDALDTFDKVYSGTRPGFLEGYEKLKAAIKPWGS
ncbi:MAG: hypothetical protein K0U93_27460, partial [Gammaproteobacteria bacterium]|nr:hypothetical protein [Gammaproteobacteria bacterium]